jgi:hypothetical protein
MSDEATIAVPAEPEPSLQEYRDERASQGTSPYRTSTAQMPPLPPGELAKRREAKASERRQELQAIRAEAEAKLRELEGGRFGTSEAPVQPSAEPAQPAANVDLAPVREAQPKAEATEKPAEQPKPQLPENLSPEDRAFQERHYAKANDLATRLKQTMEADPEFAEASKACDKVLLPAAAQVAIVESRNAHDIAVYLTRNVHEVERLTQRFQDACDHVYQLTGDINLALAYGNQFAIGEVQRISAGLEYGNGGRTLSRVVQKPVSTAPEPIKPVGGTSSPIAGEEAWEDLPLAQVRKLRESGRLR